MGQVPLLGGSLGNGQSHAGLCHPDVVKAVVWVSSWQMECCGDPFDVGSRVTWTAEAAGHDEWLMDALDPGTARRISHVEEHHSDGSSGLVELRGVVRSIVQAWGRYAARTPDARVLHSVPGSAAYVAVQDSALPDRSANPSLTFNGWIVDLDLDD